MNETKHTPGPWELTTRGTNISGVHVACTIYMQNGGTVDLQSQEHLGRSDALLADECVANARLIAAAPDLLEALQRLSGQCDRMLLPGQKPTSAEQNARDVIAKATGEKS